MKQISIDASACADSPKNDQVQEGRTHHVSADLAYQRLMIVNLVYFGAPGSRDRQWALIDVGLPGTAHFIKRAAAERFGEDSRPACIIMTHAHADHAGALENLAKEWDVPIFAHELELPYLNGTAAYPAPDPLVGGGLMPALSVLFPRGPFNVGGWVERLPADHSVPGMPGWAWLHTPGHTPGHISLWRAADRALIAGDAFITTNQESVYAVLAQKPEMHGPPMYYTQNWEQAAESVARLAMLRPEVVITGHGHAMRGAQMRAGLQALASQFQQVAVPPRGKYTEHPTSVEAGNAYVVRGK
ncbi:MAG TPA: MBL fold metallo-hydrolase [Verrucomicrobiae bacterium]